MMRGIFLLFLILFGSANGTHAEKPAAAIPAELILERFAVNKGGDVLLLPVKIAGKVRLFMVNTAASHTVIDASLFPEKSRKFLTTGIASGEVKVKTYRAPDAWVGTLPLGLTTVVGLDLKPVREVSGYPIEGILGIDFLGRYVMQVDFDRGEILLLKSLPKDPGEVFVIGKNSKSVPSVEVEVSPRQYAQFIINTGEIGQESGSMVGDKLKHGGDYRKVGSSLYETPSGTHALEIFQGKRLVLGSFSVERPIFGGSTDYSLLGLKFWSRFVLTFDFPNQKMYLKRGEGYTQPDLRNLSGLHLLKRDGVVVVHSVDKGSSASLAGMQAGDAIMSLGTAKVQVESLFEIRKSLCRPGPVKCTIQRGFQEHVMMLELPR